MLESIFIVLLILAVIMMVLSFEWQSMTITALDIVLWLILSINIYNIEIAYQYTSGGTVYEEVQQISSMYPLTWIFWGLTCIMFIYFIYQAFELIRGHKPKIM